ncbi:MAG: UPF0104 family protein [Alphaproteobacteria bacterium]|nr:UPF0104 family protein [Alphaproteobacteria bacterium]
MSLSSRLQAWKKPATGLISLGIFGLSIYFVAQTLHTLNWDDMLTALSQIGPDQFILAGVFTCLALIAWTGYDGLAARQLKLNVSYPVLSLSALCCYAFGNMLGFSLLTGSTVRYWIYSQVGVPAGKVASLIVIASFTYWLGAYLLIGLTFTFAADQMTPIFHLPENMNRLIGIGILSALTIYIAWVSKSHRRMNVQGVILELPQFRITIGQILTGAADISCACLVLYSLMPQDVAIDFVPFLASYLAASVLGIASNVPGGLGPFEATMLSLIKGPTTEAFIASLLVYRMIYYVVPFLAGLVLLGLYELVRHWRKLRQARS